MASGYDTLRHGHVVTSDDPGSAIAREGRLAAGPNDNGGAAATAVVAGGVRAAGYNTYYGGAGYNNYYGGPGYDAYYGGAGYVPGPRCGYGPYPPCE